MQYKRGIYPLWKSVVISISLLRALLLAFDLPMENFIAMLVELKHHPNNCTCIVLPPTGNSFIRNGKKSTVGRVSQNTSGNRANIINYNFTHKWYNPIFLHFIHFEIIENCRVADAARPLINKVHETVPSVTQSLHFHEHLFFLFCRILSWLIYED